MPKKGKQNNLNLLKLVGFTGLLFIFSLVVLISSPKALQLTESSLLSATNQPWAKPKYLVGAVEGSEKTVKLEIVSSQIAPPSFSSAAVLAQDFDSGQILYQKNINKKLSPASTTKLMTALVAVEHFKFDDILEVNSEDLVGGSSMGVNLGEKLTFRSLLYGMLLNSGNDAAYTIASNYPGGMPTFIEKMNERVKNLGLVNTHFDNPAGFDSPNHYSSAYDMAMVAKEAVAAPQISTVVATKDTSIQSFDSSKPHVLHNLNKLLSIEGVIGIKTGFTQTSGENFIGLVERNGHKVLTVVLDSQDRFVETKTLMDWVYGNFSWEEK